MWVLRELGPQRHKGILISYLTLNDLSGKPRTTVLRPSLWGTTIAGNSEHLPREIADRGVHKALTEKIVSQGESPRLPRSEFLEPRGGCSSYNGWL